ncbi:transposase [Kitasatospora sp. NPDC051170]|uniref:transposase n=1 Tax=Kitasatospora sp. NPDC051170 TaxID=3364056 RepID=UPI00378B095D
MSGAQRGPVVVLGCRVRFERRVWTVAAVGGGGVRLMAEEGGEVVAVLLSLLFADPAFEVLDGPGVPRLLPWGLWEALPAAVRERALAWERHVREVETGRPGGEGDGGAARSEYDPTLRTLAQREAAKAAELTALGVAASAVTVRRMRARYRDGGLWGLVDGRAVRSRSVLGRADERLVGAVVEVLEENRGRSRGTLGRLRVYTDRLLVQRFGEGVVPVPSVSTFNRLVHALGDGSGLVGSRRQHRWRSARPTPPFTPTVVMAPGELVMMDSTLLDVFTVLDNGVEERAELTIALDVATRSICAAVLRPKGTRSVDAAVLLAQMLVPARMRPHWPEAFSMEQSVIPYERLVSVDERLRGVAARPVITPRTVVVDQDNVFVSASFVAACESLGITMQPTPPANGPAKGHVERAFGSIGTLFSQYVAGYTGTDVTRRGQDPEGEAVWTLRQLDELLQEWIVCGWQVREHDGLRHPMMPRTALSPNEMWAALVAVCGHVPVPLGQDDYIELMPLVRQKINDYGIRIDYRTYDHKVLNPYREQRSTAADGLWEIHYNPHSPGQVWVRLPKADAPRGYEWVTVPWIHHSLVRAPFTDFTWQYVRGTVARRGDRVQHEHDLALALRELLERTGAGLGSPRERVVAARAGAASATGAGAAVACGGADRSLEEPGVGVRLPWEVGLSRPGDGGVDGVLYESGNPFDDEDEADAQGEEVRDAVLSAGAAATGSRDDEEGEPWQPVGAMKVYDPLKEAMRW